MNFLFQKSTKSFLNWFFTNDTLKTRNWEIGLHIFINIYQTLHYEKYWWLVKWLNIFKKYVISIIASKKKEYKFETFRFLEAIQSTVFCLV